MPTQQGAAHKRVHPGLNTQSYNYAHTFPDSLPGSLSVMALPFRITEQI